MEKNLFLTKVKVKDFMMKLLVCESYNIRITVEEIKKMYVYEI